LRPSDPSDRELRTTLERRQNNFRAFCHSLFQGRRARIRREADRDKPFYMDHHEPSLILLALLILLLNFADITMTTIILDHGGVELNPLMALCIGRGFTTFFWVKILLTAVSLVILIAHKRFRLFFFKGVHLVYAFFAMYVVLIGYEVWLLSASIS